MKVSHSIITCRRIPAFSVTVMSSLEFLKSAQLHSPAADEERKNFGHNGERIGAKKRRSRRGRARRRAMLTVHAFRMLSLGVTLMIQCALCCLDSSLYVPAKLINYVLIKRMGSLAMFVRVYTWSTGRRAAAWRYGYSKIIDFWYSISSSSGGRSGKNR